jgi:hypothetical protein
VVPQCTFGTVKKALMLSVSSEFILANRHGIDFFLDSGFSAYMCPNRHWFSHLSPIPTGGIKLVDTSVVTAEAAGKININIFLPYPTGGNFILSIHDV